MSSEIERMEGWGRDFTILLHQFADVGDRIDVTSNTNGLRLHHRDVLCGIGENFIKVGLFVVYLLVCSVKNGDCLDKKKISM
jgi:hypothetical protein